MKHIRVCRSERVSRSKNDLVIYGDWVEATAVQVQDCISIATAGCEVFGIGTHWIEARELSPDHDDPDITIKNLIAQSMRAWTEGDLDSHTSCFTPGAVFITPIGECFRGHDGIHRAFASERAAMPGLQIVPTGMEISYPAPETAIILMEGVIQHSGRALPDRWASTQVAVFTPKQVWRFASQQVFHVR